MALLEREVLDANEMQLIIENKELPARVNPNAPAAEGRSTAGAEAGSGAGEHRSGTAGTGVSKLSAVSKDLIWAVAMAAQSF